MKNFIKADFHRVFTKPLRYVMLVVFGLSLIGILIYQATQGYSDIAMTQFMIGGNPIYGMLVMLVYIFTIFGDDFKAKSLQAAIGMGVSRYQVVLGKFVSYCLVMIIDLVFFTAFHTILVALMGHLVTGPVFTEICVSLLSDLLQGIVGMAIAMMIAFISQLPTVASLVYIIMQLNIMGFAMGYLLAFKIVGRLNLPALYSTPAVSNFVNRLWLGIFDLKSFLVIIAYLAVGIGVSILVFTKRELEF